MLVFRLSPSVLHTSRKCLVSISLMVPVTPDFWIGADIGRKVILIPHPSFKCSWAYLMLSSQQHCKLVWKMVASPGLANEFYVWREFKSISLIIRGLTCCYEDYWSAYLFSLTTPHSEINKPEVGSGPFCIPNKIMPMVISALCYPGLFCCLNL